MALEQIKKIFGLLSLILGILYLSVAIIAFTEIDISEVAGKDMGVWKIFIETFRKDTFFNLMFLVMGYYFSSWGVKYLKGDKKKAALNIDVNYRIIAIETDNAKNTVKIELEDARTGDTIIVQRETKYLDYFKKYIEINGDTMPGTIAALV